MAATQGITISMNNFSNQKWHTPHDIVYEYVGLEQPPVDEKCKVYIILNHYDGNRFSYMLCLTALAMLDFPDMDVNSVHVVKFAGGDHCGKWGIEFFYDHDATNLSGYKKISKPYPTTEEN